MANFAKLDSNNVVIEVHSVNDKELLDENGIEREELGIAFLVNWSGGYLYWKQTCPNETFRKNYAAIGFTYDRIKDAFIAPQPLPSWVLDEKTCKWSPPVPYPTDGKNYYWDEPTLSWIEVK